MKTNLKKVFALIFAVMFVFCFAACGEKKVPVIGISQYGEHESLDNCREGFLQGLKDAGLVEGTDYTIDYQNAGFDDNITKQIAESFSANNVALMCGIATNSATACSMAGAYKICTGSACVALSWVTASTASINSSKPLPLRAAAPVTGTPSCLDNAPIST